MRAALLIVALLAGCTADQINQGAHVFSAAAPLLVLIPGAGPACVIAAKAACAAIEAASEWPSGPGVTPTASGTTTEATMPTSDAHQPSAR